MRRTALSALLGLALALPVAAQLKAPRSASPAAPSAPAASAPSAAASEPAVSPEVAAKENAGRLAAAAWLALLDRRDWGTAWESSASTFRNSVPLGTWMDAIPKVRADVGTLEDRMPLVTGYKNQLPGRPAGDYVTVIFGSKFAQKPLEETVTVVREPDGRWRVLGYSAR